MVLIRHIFKRAYSSALYITGKNASDNYVVLKPVIDFESRIKNKVELENNLRLRQLNINLGQIEKHWHYFNYLNQQKVILEDTRIEIKNKIMNLKKGDEVVNKDEIEKLILHAQLVKGDLRNLKNNFYGVEESTALEVLSLPNVLHPKTPFYDDEVIYTFKCKPTERSEFHIDIGYERDEIEYFNPLCYYLKGDLSLFEYSIINKFEDVLLDSSFTEFSNSDFARSVIVEGCTSDLNSVFMLEDIDSENANNLNRIHLAGSSSLFSFMAYFARHIVQPSYFPLQLFASGEKYIPKETTEASLFNVSKETGVELFIATHDNEEHIERQFEDLQRLIVKLYESLNCHFRLVYCCAKNLNGYESLRMSVQMYSSYLQKYIEIGHCSMCDTYLSKRLLFTYNDGKIRKFPKIISASILRTQPLIACILEYQNLDKNDVFSSLIKNHVG